MAYLQVGLILFLCSVSGAKKAEEVRHTEVTIVKKSHLSLTCVPADLAEGATEVYLGRNRIRSLTPRVFSRIPKCSYLDLSYNEITTIESESFEGLYGLHVLDLSGNPLSTIRKDMWVGLRSLRTLSIMYTKVVQIHSCGFSHLPKLEVLKIDVWKTTELNYVLLDKSTFPDTPKQPKLQIEHNPPSRVCDTGMCWLKSAEQSQLIANYTQNGTLVTPKCSNYHDAPWSEVREKIQCHEDTVLLVIVSVGAGILLLMLLVLLWKLAGCSCNKAQTHTIMGRIPQKKPMKIAAPRKDRSGVADDIYLMSVTTFRDDMKDPDLY